MFKAKKQVKKVAPKLNKAEKRVLRLVNEFKGVIKGKALYTRVYDAIVSDLFPGLLSNKKLPPEYVRALDVLWASLK